MDIGVEHIASKKKIGKIGTSPVWLLVTKGGLHLILSTQGGRAETLATGPHVDIARFIAERKEPKVVWTELSKAQRLPYEHFAFLVPEYETLTNDIRRLQGF